MSNLHEQFSAVAKANLDTQLAILSTLTSQTFESLEKVVELNLAAARASLEESNAAVKQLISAKDPQDFINLTTAQAQPNTNKASEYLRHLTSIISNVQAELTKTTEAHVADTNRKAVARVEEFSKNAPAGSENFVALFKTAMGNANAIYDQINKSTKQAVDTLEANLDQLSQATAKGTVGTAGTVRSAKKAS